MNNDEQGRKRSREETLNGEDEKHEGRRFRQPQGDDANRVGGTMPVAQGQAGGAFLQQLVQLGQPNSTVSSAVGQPASNLSPSAGLATPQGYSNVLLAQRYNLGPSFPSNQVQSYSGLSHPPNMQLQLALAAAQNPRALLLQILRQNLPGHQDALSQQLLSNALVPGTSRPDPPSGAVGVGNLGNILDSLLSGAPAPVPLVTASAAAGGMRQAASIPFASSRGRTNTTAAANQPTAPPRRSRSPRCKLLYVSSDDESVNAYQCFARKQIELFEAKQEDVDAGAQGRNKPIVLGQVGIRCVHCAVLHPRFRARAGVYYPSRLAVLYQAAQNIVNVHLPELCESIPEDVRQRLLHLDTKRSAVGGGKTYWSDTAKVQGVIDTERGMRFHDNPLPPL